MKPNRIPGHTLLWKGAALTILDRPVEGARRGIGKCSCGEISPVLPSTYARQGWHRKHKDKIRRTTQGGTS